MHSKAEKKFDRIVFTTWRGRARANERQLWVYKMYFAESDTFQCELCAKQNELVNSNENKSNDWQ